MAYIGKNLVGMLKEVKTVNTMTGDGSDTTLTLSDTPGSVNNVLLFIDGIKQTPETDYNVIGNALTFTTAPETGTSVVAVVGNYSGIEPTDFSITSKHIASGTVSDSNIATGISSSKLSGALPAIDGSALTGIPAAVVPLFKSASDPTITSNKPLGQIWSNSTTGEMFVCTDATTNANVWYNVGEGTGNVPFPTGGAITTDGDYKVHTFTTSGVFGVAALPAASGNVVEYLVIAGGGGGGDRHAGGGGAGGYLTATNFSVSPNSYSVTVGGGGAGAIGPANYGGNGSTSVFGSISTVGGGGGGHYGGANVGIGRGKDGGSGGGGAGDPALSGGTGTSGQGNNGGNGHVNQGYRSGGGGGGAGAVGGNASGTQKNYVAGNGGAGLSSDIQISGTPVFRAGGGGGAGEASFGTNGSGGNGGGGAGTHTGTSGVSGTINLGGGGGACSLSNGGAGGSGVVIIRYKFQ